MRTVSLLPGTTVDRAAALLCSQAPARADFNGITMRARYATTKPHDIATQFRRRSEERFIIWQNSPEGREQAQRRAEAQAQIDAGMAVLAELDFSDVSAVLTWVETMADSVDRVGVRFDRAALVVLFASRGWPAGVNCGEFFDGEDARNFAGWIVGRWLASWNPMASRFVGQWREKFVAQAQA